MLRCDEVARLLAGPELAPREGRFRRWWGLKLHLAMCDQCHEYARGLGRLRAGARALWARSGPAAGQAERLHEQILRAAQSERDRTV